MPGDGGFLVERGFIVNLFAQSGDAGGSPAARALAGEPILIIPRGTFHRLGRTFTVDDGVIADFVENWLHRGERGIRRTRLAVDTDHNGRAVGWYADILPLDGGLGATFTWNDAGRRALEDGEFAYFSATVYWQIVDPVTGEVVHNQVGGGALTNYPFFGEETALYSLRVGGVGSTAPVFFAVTKTEDGVQYPARAYLVVEDPAKPTTWHLRVYSWQDGELRPDHRLMGAAKAALLSPGGHRGNRYTGPQREEAIRKLRALYESEGLEFRAKGGSVMNENITLERLGDWLVGLFSRLPPVDDGTGGGESDAGGGGDERLVELSTQIDSLREQFEQVVEERDQYRRQIEELRGTVAQVQDERDAERFAQMVRSEFAHLPTTADELAAHIRWLHETDVAGDDGTQVHAEFFCELLRRADAEFARAFAERGHGRVISGGAMQAIDSAVAEYRKEHPDVDYDVALGAVLALKPELFAAYEDERERGGV